MPVCENCHRKWSWKQTIRKTTTLDPAMSCPYCGEKQYQTQKSKTKIGIITACILLAMPILLLLEAPKIMMISLLPSSFIVGMLVYPFFVKISSKEQFIDFFKNDA
ncbi:hypothetical protein DX933_07545 [Ornithinibacillus gellani]|uniref:TIGR04104 family putative zinc finger protein n=1 Tax=Ornithinibacillus gellani TaxID=2293253 RepID=UPI000F46813D|nr:TIGR04104 family putative zinc finger protein [Ornithinibacillus gellani]TQS75187.1 hypothetical protein DX933_07545 [Ornithinibacillus gellani]